MRTEKFKDKFLSDINDELWENYNNVIKNEEKTWDCVVLTASNKNQKESYINSINLRIEKKLIPNNIDYIVIEDPDGKRVGSGGATINVFLELNKKYKDLTDKKILIINSGGDSKRVPQYSNIGKIFSPVQRFLPNGACSTLFDENMILSISLFTRIQSGCVVMAGDVLLSFNPMQIDFFNVDIASISISENVNSGCNHGVFVTDELNNVIKFLHKESIETLRNYNAINKNDNVAIDTGLLFLSSNVIKDLVNIIEGNNLKDIFINENTRLNLYNDLLIPAAKDSNKEDYLNSEGEIELNDNIYKCREIIWNFIRKYNYKVAKLSPAKFIHYGTNKELIKLLKNKELDFLNFSNRILTNDNTEENYNIYKSYIGDSVLINNNSYIENSIIENDVNVGKNTILSNVVCKNINIPNNVVLNTLKLNNNKYVTRIFGVEDNPKNIFINSKFLNNDASSFISKYKIDSDKLNYNDSLWDLNIYTLHDSTDESVEYALKLYDIINLKATIDNVKEYFCKDRISLKDSFLNSNNKYNIDLEKEIEIKVILEKFNDYVNNKIDYKIAIDLVNNSSYKNEIINELEKQENKSFRYSLYLSKLLNSLEYENECFKKINTLLKEKEQEQEKVKYLKNKTVISLPIRINFGGGWTDTIPYCIENGGSVFNGAFTLNNQLPIECIIEKNNENKIIFKSVDLNSYKEITEIDDIYCYSNAEDDFSLIKASLIATNFITNSYKNIKNFISEFNTGITFITNVKNIPKGSGLGTSSILCASIIKAIYDFTNRNLNDSKLCDLVQIVEQMISTGGGWQDQVGGMTPGLKLITSEPDIYQKIKVNYIELNQNIIDFFNNRLILIFTGQRRAAKKLVRNIMGNYILSNSDTLNSINVIKDLSKKMYQSIKEENFNEFIILMNKHWEMSKTLDRNCTNKSINLIIESIEDLIDSKMICGAGGGGFLQIVLKSGIKKEDVESVIDNIYQDCGVKCYSIKIHR